MHNVRVRVEIEILESELLLFKTKNFYLHSKHPYNELLLISLFYSSFFFLSFSEVNFLKS